MNRYTFGLVGVCALVVVGWLWSANERTKGALRVLTQQADSTHRADSVKHLMVSDSAKGARFSADSLRRLARLEVVKDARFRMAADSVAAQSASERANALRLLADSVADRDSLRASLSRLIARAIADSVSLERERARHDSTVAAFLRSAVSDSTAIARGLSAENAAVQRAVAAERQRDLYAKAKPSAFGNVLRAVQWGPVGFAVGKLTR